MEEKKLTDEEIVKALEMNCLCVVYGKENCESCLLFDKDCRILPNAVVDLIQRQKAEIERLTEEVDLYKNQFNELEPRFFDLRYEHAELQKKVDELKERAKIDLKNERNWSKIQIKQAVKGTAKEIIVELNRLKNTARENYGVSEQAGVDMAINRVESYIQQKCVEVKQ